MALNIKNPEVERLVAEVARLTGDTKTETVRKALLAQKKRLSVGGRPDRAARLRSFLEGELWSSLPPELRGRSVTKDDRERTLGLGQLARRRRRGS